MLSITKKLFLVAACAIFLVAGQAGAASDAKPASKPASKPVPGTKEYANEVILRVDGVEYTRAVFESRMNSAIPRMSLHSSVSDERKEGIRATVVAVMISDALVGKVAARDKEVVASVTQKDIDEKIEVIKKNLPEGTTMKQLLKNSGMTKDDMAAYIRNELQIANYYQKMKKDSIARADKTVDDAYAKDYYQKNLAKFVEPEQVHMRLILLKADPSGGTKVWAEVYKKAKELTDKARAGEDFARMAKQYSQDEQTAKKDGDMGWQHRGSLMEEIDVVVDKMKPGDVSEPINTLYGYLVVKLEEVKPEIQKKFEELNLKKLKLELSDKLAGKLYKDWLDGLVSKAKIEYLSEEVIVK